MMGFFKSIASIDEKGEFNLNTTEYAEAEAAVKKAEYAKSSSETVSPPPPHVHSLL